MKYIQGFKSFNEGLFTTNENDDQIGTEILDKLSKIEFEVEMIDKLQYMAMNLKLDENPGTYNITSNFVELKLEYYKNDKLLFKQMVKCMQPLGKAIFNVLQNKYLAENNI